LGKNKLAVAPMGAGAQLREEDGANKGGGVKKLGRGTKEGKLAGK